MHLLLSASEVRPGILRLQEYFIGRFITEPGSRLSANKRKNVSEMTKPTAKPSVPHTSGQEPADLGDPSFVNVRGLTLFRAHCEPKVRASCSHRSRSSPVAILAKERASVFCAPAYTPRILHPSATALLVRLPCVSLGIRQNPDWSSVAPLSAQTLHQSSCLLHVSLVGFLDSEPSWRHRHHFG